ncbi:uncharacterized protein LOC130669920 [Microplitis mediator]|uniref:uncharacterized protein LOC130669920 n=1 Tax=Microplitis mediator TaxID=375433 RepID=UPI002556090C|nr:uncharacterized protein LOC130669920 [Microplitis mediator]
MSVATKFLALVKWVGGVDDKKYTSGIQLEHIKNFEYEKFQNDELDPDKVYVVKWHDTTKEPLGGWICYNAKVIAVSKSIATLNKKLQALDGVQSPKRVANKINLNICNASTSSDVQEIDVNEGAEITEVPAFGCDGDQTRIDNEEVTNSTEHLKSVNDADIIFIPSNDDNSRKSLDDPPNVNGPEETPEKVREVSSDSIFTQVVDKQQYVTIEILEKALKDVTQKLLPASSNSVSTDSQPNVSLHGKNDSKLEQSHQDNLEIGNPGSNVFITETQYDTCRHTNTVTAMTTALLMSVFPHDVLLVSNCKGGAPKNAKDNTVRHQALDEKKLNAMKETVKRRFKSAFKESDFNRAINVKCSKLRKIDRDSKVPNVQDNHNNNEDQE